MALTTFQITNYSRPNWFDNSSDVVEAELFGGSVPSINVWTGAAWEAKPLYYWNGSAWVAPIAIHRWDGSAWVQTVY